MKALAMGQGTSNRVTQQKRLLLLLCGVPTTLVSASFNVAWGGSSYGGSIPAATHGALNAASGVSHIASTSRAFVVRTSAGQWYAWGNSGYGGSIPAATQSALDAASGVSHIASTDWAFVVRTSAGQWYAWGNSGNISGVYSNGGSIPAATQTALDAAPGVSHIASTGSAFVVRTSAGQWYAWGYSSYGGSIPAATQSALDAA
eukprot:COSAG01_NODE_17502_length_1145_cov_2.849904_1_plen_202_part_10